MKAFAIAAAAVVIASQSPAAPAPTGNRDVHCLMLSNLFLKTAPAELAKESAGQARLFYLGRVSGKLVPAQLAPALTAEAKTLDLDHAGLDMNKCLGTVQAAQLAVEAAGKKVQAAAGPPSPPAH